MTEMVKLMHEGEESSENSLPDADDHDHKKKAGASLKSAKGLGVWVAAMFILGEMAGTGVLTLPKAVVDCGGILGVVLLIFLAGTAMYTGVILGYCWQMLEDRYEEYRLTHVQDPYNEIGYRAAGNAGAYALLICNYGSVFCGGVVFLLLDGEMVMELTVNVLPGMTVCTWIVAIAGIIIPLTWIGTPKDMTFVGLAAPLATALATIFIITIMILTIPKVPSPVRHSNATFGKTFAAFGTFVFTLCGHFTFPTIQHDMENPKKFLNVVVIAYTGLLLMFVPSSFAGYLIYGDLAKDNIIGTIQQFNSGWIIRFVQVFLLLHLMLAFLIITNTLSQSLEGIFRVKNEFGYKRVIIRTIMVCVMLFVGETVPKFGPIMMLVGGSMMNCVMYVFPVLFYELLCRDEKFPKIHLPLHIHVIHVEILLISIIAGAAACYSAINEMTSPGTFVPPCYVSTQMCHGS